MKSAPDISIVVSCWNASDIVESALESIVATAGDVAVEVTIIDDASTDGGFAHVAEKFKSDTRFTFVKNETNVGISALNIMLERSRAKYILLLDSDARLLPGVLQALLAFMENTPNAGAATGNLHYPNGSLQNYYRRLMTPMRAFFTTVPGRFVDKYFLGLRNYNSYHYQDLDATRVFEIEQPPLSCLILRREALGSRILDPDFSTLFIDVDLCRRIYDCGYKIYLVPDAKVTHIKSVDFSRRPRAARNLVFYTGLQSYFNKHYPASALLMSVIMLVDRVLRALMERTIGRAPMR
ncbi:MAG TPA: glycosyltransferase [Candidatus Paceibacterota bacterium]